MLFIVFLVVGAIYAIMAATRRRRVITRGFRPLTTGQKTINYLLLLIMVFSFTGGLIQTFGQSGSDEIAHVKKKPLFAPKKHKKHHAKKEEMAESISTDSQTTSDDTTSSNDNNSSQTDSNNNDSSTNNDSQTQTTSKRRTSSTSTWRARSYTPSRSSYDQNYGYNTGGTTTPAPAAPVVEQPAATEPTVNVVSEAGE